MCVRWPADQPQTPADSEPAKTEQEHIVYATLPTRVVRTTCRETRPRRLTANERLTSRNLRPARTNARRNAILASLAGC